jgi:hypothetical protein
MFSRPTLGRSFSSIAATSAEPSTANCNRCSGVHSTFAPRSRTVVTPPFSFGSTEAIAGRSMPSSVFSTKREIAISAPVLPALTQASARSSFTRLTATRIDESRLPRSACAGGSSISTTSSACTTCSRLRSAATRVRCGSISPARPTRRSSAAGVARANAIAAGTVTDGP